MDILAGIVGACLMVSAGVLIGSAIASLLNSSSKESAEEPSNMNQQPYGLDVCHEYPVESHVVIFDENDEPFCEKTDVFILYLEASEFESYKKTLAKGKENHLMRALYLNNELSRQECEDMKQTYIRNGYVLTKEAMQKYRKEFEKTC